MLEKLSSFFLERYIDRSALTHRRASALFYLHLFFMPMVVIFLVAAWTFEGYTPKLPIMAGIILMLGFNLWLIQRERYSAAVLLTLLYSLAGLSVTVYLASDPRHFLLYNLALFHVLTLLLAGLISHYMRDSIIIAVLSIGILTHYCFAVVVPAELLPISDYIHNYFAVLILVVIAGVIGTYLNHQMNSLFGELEGINERLEETVEERSAALVESEKLAALGGMVGGISHEINTPIGNSVTIISYLLHEFEQLSERMAGGELTRSQLERFASLGLESMKAADRNLEIARNLVINFKRIAADLHYEDPREQNIRDEIELVLASMQNRLKQLPKLQVRIEGSEDLVTPVPPGLLWHVFTNFINNSLIHGLPDGDGRIVIGFAMNGGRLELNYSDDGKGMDAQTLRRQFEPFFTTRRGSGGTGLGLNLIYNLITKIGGSIRSDSKPGQGVNYRIQLPRIEGESLHANTLHPEQNV
jgi:signal transduction histidine kinase